MRARDLRRPGEGRPVAHVATIYTSPIRRADRVERIGHRGAQDASSAKTPSPPSARAFERGADAIELDVHATRDGVVVVHHDPSGRRLAGPLAGRAIAELDWTTVDGVELRRRTSRIPTLADVLGVVSRRTHRLRRDQGPRIEARSPRHSWTRRPLRRPLLRPRGHRDDARHRAGDSARNSVRASGPADIEAAMAATGARDVWPEWSSSTRPSSTRSTRRGPRDRLDGELARGRRASGRDLGIDGLCTDDVRLLDGL